MNRQCVGKAYEGTEFIELHGRIDAPENPKAACVIVHGLAEHYGRYDYVAEKLLGAGYAVVRFDHRGHGRSEGKPIYYEDRTEIVEDIDIFVEMAAREFPDLPLFMIGHSMGGFGATSYGTTFPGKVDFYVISGALTRDCRGITALDPSIPNDIYVPNALGSGVCSDPAVVAAYAADPLVAKELSVKIFRVMQDGVAWLTANAQAFVDPVILLHGTDDGLVSPKDSLLFFDEIASTDKSLRIYGGLMHEVFNEFARDRVIRDAIEWMDDKLSSQ